LENSFADGAGARDRIESALKRLSAASLGRNHGSRSKFGEMRQIETSGGSEQCLPLVLFCLTLRLAL